MKNGVMLLALMYDCVIWIFVNLSSVHFIQTIFWLRGVFSKLKITHKQNDTLKMEK